MNICSNQYASIMYGTGKYYFCEIDNVNDNVKVHLLVGEYVNARDPHLVYYAHRLVLYGNDLVN